MELISGALAAALTLGVIAAGFTVLAVVIIARRARRAPIAADATRRARELEVGSALVRLDDALRDAHDELGFALAQFGPDEAREFAATIQSAQADAREAFALQQRLDDEIPDSEVHRREWSARILALCDRALRGLIEQDRRFEARRRRESDAPTELAQVRRSIAELQQRIASAPSAEAAEARTRLDEAERSADAIEAALRGTSTAPVGARLHDAWRALAGAAAVLDARDRAARERADAASRLASTVDATRVDLDRARTLRDRHEVPAQRDAITSALDDVAAALASASHALAGRAASGAGADVDPSTALDRLLRARARLDTATATALSAEQRLVQAREALAGALRQAERHIAVASDVIVVHRGRVGAAARTRLAEANRQLDLARDEADPVAALDAARRASSRAQDAEALARYDAR